MKKIALIIVDYQNDFADPNNGSLYVKGGEKIVNKINEVMKNVKNNGGLVLASRELHTKGHISFASSFKDKEEITIPLSKGFNPTEKNFVILEELKNKGLIKKDANFNLKQLEKYLINSGDKQPLWPEHCIKGNLGSEFYKSLETNLIDIEIKKGFNSNSHPYSAFDGNTLDEKKTTLEVLKENKIEIIKVVGLATDYCVNNTVIDAVKLGFYVELIESATAGVDEKNTLQKIDEMKKIGVDIIY